MKLRPSQSSLPKDTKIYHKIWLGLTEDTLSLRDYPSLKSIWEMVAITAFTQLNYSLVLLLGTVIGMILVYLVPLISLIIGILIGNQFLIWVSIFT